MIRQTAQIGKAACHKGSIYYLYREMVMLEEIVKHELFDSRQNSDSYSMGVVETPSKLLVIRAAEGAAGALADTVKVALPVDYPLLHSFPCPLNG